MKKLSYWSKNNPVKARIIIGVSHVLLLIIGMSLGIITYIDELHIPNGFLITMVSVFFIAYMLYPVRGRKTGILKYSFYRRVKHDFILVMASSCVLAAGVNNFAFQPLLIHQPQPPFTLMIAKGSFEDPGLIEKELRKNILKQIKQIRTDIKQTLKLMKADAQTGNDKKVGLKVFLIFLVLLGAAISLGGVATLSCELSCSGHEGMAVVVAVGGTAAIIGLSILAIVSILKIGKPRPVPVKKEEGKVIS